MYIQHETYIELNGSMIPVADENPDYQRFLAWVAEGNTPGEPPSLSLEQRAAVLLAGVDAHLDAAAQAKGYDNRNTFYMRAAVPGSPFHAEGLAFATWMDLVYAKCYEVLAAVQAGDIEEPTLEQLIGMLPELQLPAQGT